MAWYPSVQQMARDYLTRWGVPAGGGADQLRDLTNVIRLAIHYARVGRSRRPEPKRKR
jgi:hypothetical protein